MLCVDKTGTLTQNRMAVRRLWIPGKEFNIEDLEGTFPSELLEVALLASEREPFDPMEKAYHQLAPEHAPVTVEKLDAWTLSHAYPLTPEQLSVAHVWQTQGGDGYVVAAKGPRRHRGNVCAER